MTEAMKSYSARRAELDGMRFIEVRNLAHLSYKKDDGTELMSYTQTLEDRDKVKQTILEYELAKGMITPDGTMGQAAAPQPAVPQGAPQMTMPFQPQFAPPQNGQPNGVPQQMAPPQYQQPQQMAPPPMATLAPVATPMQAAQAGQQVQQQMAPAGEPPAAATGRKRRTAGTAVAPPPAPPPQMAPPPAAGFMAPPQMVQPQQPVPVQQFAPPQQFAPQGFVPPGQPQQFAAQPPQGFQPPQQAPQQQFAPPPAVQAAPQGAGVDLSPLLAKIDSLGGAVNQLLEVVTNQKAQIDNLTGQLTDTRRATLEALTCLQHMYLTHPQLAPGAQGKNTLPEFRQFLGQFVGPQ